MQSKRTMRSCQTCANPFPFSPWMAKKGGGKFCSRSCYWASIPLQAAPIADRFWPKVNKDGPIVQPELGPCWIWTASKDTNGYGRMSRGKIRETPVSATHVSWFLEHGTWPNAGCLHHCDNPPCVRPDHLFDGDQAANSADMAAKGRSTRGERSGSAKLTDALAIEIRARYAAGSISQAKLAAEYGVRQMAVSDLVRGVTWRHLLT